MQKNQCPGSVQIKQHTQTTPDQSEKDHDPRNVEKRCLLIRSLAMTVTWPSQKKLAEP